jgi:hypothetical protein
MRVVRGTIAWMIAALMLAQAPALEAVAQDKSKTEVVPQIGHPTSTSSLQPAT